jgi:hypothetical protein
MPERFRGQQHDGCGELDADGVPGWDLQRDYVYGIQWHDLDVSDDEL